jgi:hypothetical protein
MSEGKDTIVGMKKFYVLTGELVEIIAETEEEMWELLASGVYDEVETLSEIQSVEEVEYDEE